MKTHIDKSADVDWSSARALLSDLKSTVRLSLAIQILLGKELATCKIQLGFIRGRHIIIRQTGGSQKSWDQYCREELELASRTVDRYIQCFEAAKARASNLKAKACRKSAGALSAGETKDSAKWKKLIKKFDAIIGVLQTPAAELSGGEIKELAAHVGFLIQRQDPQKHPTAAANITQAELLEELGIKAASKPLTGGKNSVNRSALSGEDAESAFQQFVRDLFSGIRSGCGDLEKTIFRGRSWADVHAALEFIPLASEDKNAPCLYAIRESLSAVFDGELPKMIEAVNRTIKEKENPDKPAKQRRVKHINA